MNILDPKTKEIEWQAGFYPANNQKVKLVINLIEGHNQYCLEVRKAKGETWDFKNSKKITDQKLIDAITQQPFIFILNGGNILHKEYLFQNKEKTFFIYVCAMSVSRVQPKNFYAEIL